MDPAHAIIKANWVKNHPLEGDSLITGIYKILHKRDVKTMKACKDIILPDTVVFEHNFPRGWFTTDMKNKELAKRPAKDLDAVTIYRNFFKLADPEVNIVASFLSTIDVEDKKTGLVEAHTHVEFFNQKDLKEFLGRKNKREGILQKFLISKGSHNSVIQVIWSPRVCLVQRRTNTIPFKSKLKYDKGPL